MSDNSFGRLFRVTTWGESHGPAIGCAVDGVPPRLPLSEADIQPWLDRRRPGRSRFTSQRREPDAVRIVAGVFEGQTTGMPVALVIDNVDARAPGLWRHQGQVPSRPRRLHLPAEIRHPRPSRLGPRLGPRDGDAGRGRRRRAQGAGPRRDDPGRAGADRRARHRARPLGLERGRQQPVLVPRRGHGRHLGDLSRRSAQAGQLGRRGGRNRRRGRPDGAGRAGLRQARRRPRERADEHQRGQGRRDRRRLRGGAADRPCRRRRDAHGRRRREVPCPTTPAACSGASRPARTSSPASPSSRHRRSRGRCAPSTAPATRSRSPPRGATTPASASARCRWARPWSPACWADHLLRQRAQTGAAAGSP